MFSKRMYGVFALCLVLFLAVAVKVADVASLSVASPARPKASTAHDDDRSLALASSDIPTVRSEWREDVRARHHVIRSLFSDDFSDLQFLKPLLGNKRVVMLGESSHGVAEFNWIKVRLVKFLNQEMGFDVVAFESSMSGCDIADERIGIAAPIDVMRDCIFRVWHSSETLGLFEYLDTVRKQGKRISLTGFDTQNSGTASAGVTARFNTLLEVADPKLAPRIAAAEQRLMNWSTKEPTAEEAAEIVADYKAAAAAMQRSRARLHEHHSSRTVDLAIQEAVSRVTLFGQITAVPRIEGGKIRDKGMADNLDFLLDHLYSGRKIVVWAHNFHIAKEQAGQNQPQAMGAWVAQRRMQESYAVGIYMGRGAQASNGREIYEVKPPRADSMEAVLANAGWKMTFVDFSTAKPGKTSAWMFQPLQARGAYAR
jgi:erythromycin esterase